MNGWRVTFGRWVLHVSPTLRRVLLGEKVGSAVVARWVWP